jgi:hypothetical protein
MLRRAFRLLSTPEQEGFLDVALEALSGAERWAMLETAFESFSAPDQRAFMDAVLKAGGAPGGNGRASS